MSIVSSGVAFARALVQVVDDAPAELALPVGVAAAEVGPQPLAHELVERQPSPSGSVNVSARSRS